MYCSTLRNARRAIQSIVAMSTIAVLAAPAAHAQTITFEPGSASGLQAPGAPVGVTFSAIDLGVGFPFINNAGEIAFTANLTGPGVTGTNDRGIWVGKPGSLVLAIREGDAAPEIGGGITIGALSDNFSPALNPNGRIAFRATLAGPGVSATNDMAMWSGPPTSLSLMAREGGTAPGPWVPGFMTFASFDPPLLNSFNQVCFFGTTNASPSPDSGIWIGAPGSLSTAVFEGDPAPDTGPGISFLDFTPASVRVNGPGQIAFLATVTGPGVGGANNLGLWAGTPGSVHLMAREGNAAPGQDDDDPSPGVFFAMEDPVLNDTGAVSFRGFLGGPGVTTDTDFGVWRGLALGVTNLIMLEGGAVLDLPIGHTYNNLEALFGNGFPRLDAANRVAFRARLAGPTITAANDVAIVSLNDLGALHIIAREGDAVPDVPAGVTFAALQGLPAAAVSPVMNGAGQLAFLATLTGTGVTFANDLAIFATDPFGVMHLVVREGQTIEVAPGNFRTISLLRPITGTGGNNGRNSSFNDSGQLVFRADFSDGTAGILVANINDVCRPVFVSNPESAVTSIGAPVDFTVSASGAGVLTYQWRHNGTPLSDGGNIAGATTATLTVTPGDVGDAGAYDCVVLNACGSSTSAAAVLTVCDGSPDGDVNLSGDADGDDIAVFVAAVLSGTAGGPVVCRGDFSGDYEIDVADIPGFVSVLLGL